MTTNTISGNARMIDRRSRPLVGGMTGVAFLIGLYGDVIISRTCGNGAVMTT